VLVLREEIQDGLVGDADVLGVAAERHPAEGAFALAEERADVGGHEAGIGEGILTP
jgi:hypothetical protein